MNLKSRMVTLQIISCQLIHQVFDVHPDSFCPRQLMLFVFTSRFYSWTDVFYFFSFQYWLNNDKKISKQIGGKYTVRQRELFCQCCHAVLCFVAQHAQVRIFAYLLQHHLPLSLWEICSCCCCHGEVSQRKCALLGGIPEQRTCQNKIRKCSSGSWCGNAFVSKGMLKACCDLLFIRLFAESWVPPSLISNTVFPLNCIISLRRLCAKCLLPEAPQPGSSGALDTFAASNEMRISHHRHEKSFWF